jgi:hypothetical protein
MSIRREGVTKWRRLAGEYPATWHNPAADGHRPDAAARRDGPAATNPEHEPC